MVTLTPPGALAEPPSVPTMPLHSLCPPSPDPAVCQPRTALVYRMLTQ